MKKVCQYVLFIQLLSIGSCNLLYSQDDYSTANGAESRLFSVSAAVAYVEGDMGIIKQFFFAMPEEQYRLYIRRSSILSSKDENK